MERTIHFFFQFANRWLRKLHQAAHVVKYLIELFVAPIHFGNSISLIMINPSKMNGEL